jgi:hypothetical protein
MPGTKRPLLFLFPLALTVSALVWGTTNPSNQRDWAANLAVLPYAEFEGHLVRVRNIRNTSYETAATYTPAYYDRTFHLNRLEAVWFLVEPLSKRGAVAHTFLSFGFEGPEYVAISVEARKEKRESYHFLKGLFGRYELMYLVADERDVIRLRTSYRRDDVYLYPIKASRESMRELFVAMLSRANQLRERPEFYNTLTSNCTSNIIGHVNSLSPRRIPFSLKRLLPGYSDRLAYELGLIDTRLPFEQARRRFKINERALEYADSPEFSIRIREPEPH